MESILLAIEPSDPLWIAIAFVCGFAVTLIGLPPLVGFLIAGFLLNVAGAESGEFLRATADLGVTLLLFTIGLKLKLGSLARPQVWGVGVIHMASVTIMLLLLLMALSATGLPLFSNLDFSSALLIGFALSFSSTVFAVKILDDSGTAGTCFGRTSIGVLIVQDVAAVAFLAVSTGKVPSIWAFLLLLLIPLRHLLVRILMHSGHGELLVLYGVVLALGGADLFELVEMKGDLGALVVGMLLAHHPKADELAKMLLSFKELFLVGFFLSVGMTALPGWPELLAALLLLIFLPIKVSLYLGLFTAFKLRIRMAWRASLNLANYSEFGLIVGTIAVASDLLPKEWLTIFAILLALSFIIAAPIATSGDSLYLRLCPFLKGLERRQRLPGDEDLEVGEIEVLVFGMGRVGSAVYDAISQDFPGRVLGVDLDKGKIKDHLTAGRIVANGDGTNPDFWIRAPGLEKRLKWVMLTMPTHKANLAAAVNIRKLGFSGSIASTTQWPDDAEKLQEIGVDYVFNIYQEAGTGFANDLRQRLATTV